jgi:hypothetical protein
VLRFFQRRNFEVQEHCALAELLGTFRADNLGWTLSAATSYLDGIVAAEKEDADRSLQAISDRLAKPLGDFFDTLFEAKGDYHLESLIAAVEAFSRTVARECHAYVEAYQTGEIRRIGLMHWHIWKKMARFRYCALPQADWRIGWDLAGIDLVALTPSLCLELAPLGSMTIPEIELTDRLLQANAGSLFHSSERSEIVTHVTCPDSYPLRIGREIRSGQTYLSVIKLSGLLRRIDEACIKAPASVVESTRRLLLSAWSAHPPSRLEERRECSIQVYMVSGFFLTRRMLACAELARSGKMVEYEVRKRLEARDAQLDERLERQIDTAPLDLLSLLESAGDRQMMRSAQVVNISNSGAGIAGAHAKSRPGALVCWRGANTVDWRPCLVRQVRKGNKGMSVGVEFLTDINAVASSITFDLETPNNLTAAIDAIVLDDESGQVARLLVPNDTMEAGTTFLLKRHGRWVPCHADKVQERADTDFAAVTCHTLGGQRKDCLASHLHDLLFVI